MKEYTVLFNGSVTYGEMRRVMNGSLGEQLDWFHDNVTVHDSDGNVVDLDDFTVPEASQLINQAAEGFTTAR